jgi:4-amino-4-deoxy-L-arabinose transferase-like glycosyltransferase
MEAFLVQWLSFLAFAAIIAAFLLCHLQQRKDTLAWILLGYFCVCFTLIIVKGYLRLNLANYDIEKYQAASAQIAALLRADFWGNLPYVLKPYAAYTLPLGLLYYVFGTSEPLGQLLNTVMGLGIILNLHRLATLWFNRRIADHTALFLSLYPYGWILSSTLNRDMMIAFGITLFFCLLSELQGREGTGSRLWLLLAALGSLFYMALLRPPLLILGAIALFVYWMVNPLAKSKRGRLYRTVRLSFIILVVFLGSTNFYLFGKYYLARSHLEQEATQFSDIGNINQRLRISEDAGSAYMRGVKYSSYLDIVKVMPWATVNFMFSPLPWQVTSPKQALGILDSTWLMLVCVYFLKGIKALYRRNRKLTLALLTFLIVGVTTSSVLQANAGSAMRHRTMFSFLMFPVAVHGVTRRQVARSPIRVRVRASESKR